jgi:membrane-bound metal-dependent hydrolase YbcI (DUF457 family)
MTSYEHVMLGVTGGLAVGLHRRYGWQIVAMAGVAALLPDWDGLSLLAGPAAFDRVHRTWGHSLWAAALVGALFAALEYRFRWLDRAGRWLLKTFPLRRTEAAPPVEAPSAAGGSLLAWMAVGALAAWSHLAADVVFSGHSQLADWGIRLLWPLSERAWAYPMVPWGDPTVAILFAVGMFAMVRWPKRIQAVAIATLAAVAIYTAVRIPLVGAF